MPLRVEETDDLEKFKVSGRGELHLENFDWKYAAWSGYELAVSRPEVIIRAKLTAKKLTVWIGNRRRGRKQPR